MCADCIFQILKLLGNKYYNINFIHNVILKHLKLLKYKLYTKSIANIYYIDCRKNENYCYEYYIIF
jgi:hypothetical protein